MYLYTVRIWKFCLRALRKSFGNANIRRLDNYIKSESRVAVVMLVKYEYISNDNNDNAPLVIGF